MIQLIAFEGLSPWLFSTPTYLKRGLLDPLDLTFRNADVRVWRGSFMSRGPWIHPETGKIIVIGHSMGGPSAIWFCNQLRSSADLLITLDPRPLHRPYVKPANVKRAVNFYQTGFMRGYEVEGAENLRVHVGHTQIPALEAVRKLVTRYL